MATDLPEIMIFTISIVCKQYNNYEWFFILPDIQIRLGDGLSLQNLSPCFPFSTPHQKWISASGLHIRNGVPTLAWRWGFLSDSSPNLVLIFFSAPVKEKQYCILYWYRYCIITGRPPWQVYILTDFGEAKDTIILTRTHPCLSGNWSRPRNNAKKHPLLIGRQSSDAIRQPSIPDWQPSVAIWVAVKQQSVAICQMVASAY